MATVLVETVEKKAKTQEAPSTGVSAEVRDEVWKNFVAFLKKGGHNITETRRIILDAVLGREDHFRADQLAAQLATGPQRVSRGSVYRTLALLAEAGIVRTVRNGEAHVHYEHVIDRAIHEHMVCDRCGRFVEFDPDEIMMLIDRVCDRHKFQPRMYRLVIYGLCEACRGAGAK